MIRDLPVYSRTGRKHLDIVFDLDEAQNILNGLSKVETPYWNRRTDIYLGQDDLDELVKYYVPYCPSLYRRIQSDGSPKSTKTLSRS